MTPVVPDGLPIVMRLSAERDLPGARLRVPHRDPLRLTITAEKIDRVLNDIQQQVERLEREMLSLRLVRDQLAMMEQRGKGSFGLIAGEETEVCRTLTG